jgi:hypothetical protein
MANYQIMEKQIVLINLDPNKKVAFLLGISELVFSNMTDNAYHVKIREALDLCWERWVIEIEE